MTDEDLVDALSSPHALGAWCKLRRGRPFDLWGHQRAILDALLAGRSIVVLKARQLGVSEVLCLYILWMAMTRPESSIICVSVGEREAFKLIERIKALHKSLPDRLRAYAPINGRENLGMVQIGTSTIQSFPSGAGRSFTADFLFMDEPAHWDQADERLAQLLPTAADEGQVAAVSTANGIGTEFWRLWAKLRIGWYRIFAGALARPTRTVEWVEEQRTALGHKGPQEYPYTAEEAFLSSGISIFDAAGISWQLEHMAKTGTSYEVSRTGFSHTDTGRWMLYRPPEEGREYILTADSSGGGRGSDPSAAVIYDAQAREQVAAFSARLTPAQFAREIAFAGRIFNMALLAPEANDHGKAVVAHLESGGYPAIYEAERFDTAQGGVAGHQLGWVQTRAAKHTAVGALANGLITKTLAIRDAEALDEMTRFAELAPGRFGAVSGHDDRVICHAMAVAIMDYSLAHGGLATGEPDTPYWRVQDRRTGY